MGKTRLRSERLNRHDARARWGCRSRATFADKRDVQSGFERPLNPRTSSTAAGEVADTALAFVQRVLV
jgi:hypothetical protein